MAVITLPAAVLQSIASFSYGQVRYDTADVSDATGAAFTLVYGPPRWTLSLASKAAMPLDQAGEWEAVMLKLRGGINHLAVYDVLRPAPLGTMRGSPLLGVAAAVGDTVLQVDNVIGTGKRGDWLGIGTGLGTSQLVKVVEPYASAVLTPGAFSWTLSASPFTWTLGGQPFTWSRPGARVAITVEAPLRLAFPRFSAVVWDRPLGYYKQTNTSQRWQARANGPAIDGFATDLLEQWA